MKYFIVPAMIFNTSCPFAIPVLNYVEWGFNPWEYMLHSPRGLASFHLPTMPCALLKAVCSTALMRNYVWLKQHLGDSRWSAAAASPHLPPQKELLLGFKRIKWVCDNRGIKREKDWIRKGPLGLKRATSRSRVQSPVVTTHSPPLHPDHPPSTHFPLGSFVHSAVWVFIRNANASNPDLQDDILEVARKLNK